MKRNLASTIINLLGLSLGLSCSFIILLYVIGEYSFEKGQEHRDNIYRIISKDKQDGRDLYYAINYGALSSTIKEEIPEIEKACILDARINRPFYVKTGTEYTLEKGSVYNVGSDYFDIFTVPLIRGNQDNIIDDPGSIVLSKDMASKYFGDEDPLGKTIHFLYEKENFDYTVTGIMDKPDFPSGFTPDFITRFDTRANKFFMAWNYIVYEVFVKVSPSADINAIEHKLNGLGKKYHPDKKMEYLLQHSKDFHLNSGHIHGSHMQKGNKSTIMIFSGIGILILLIACINYIILATAESSLRYKEIGLKKVVGANRIGIISQIQIESLLMAVLALPIALLIVERSHSSLGRIFGHEFYFSYTGNWIFILGFILITLIVGSISGMYISFHLSRLKPVTILSGQVVRKPGKSIPRKILIGFQLIIFLVLFCSTIIIQKQIKFALSHNTNFELEKLLIIQDDQNRIANFDVFKTELENHPDFKSVSSSMSNLFLRNRFANLAYLPEKPDKSVAIEQYHIDRDYLETLGIKIAKGKSFAQEESEGINRAIINQTAALELGLNDPIGKTIISNTMYDPEEKEYEIIGVIDDFISGSVKRGIGSFMLVVRQTSLPPKSIAIRLNNRLSESGLEHLTHTWSSQTDGKPLEFKKMDELFEELYRKETTLSRVFTLFTILAIFISCLGLFGLSLFVARRKNKEIGIRKVHGANLTDIIRMMLNEFILVVILANCLALPVSLFAMRKWLNAFAYKINPDPGIFILALFVSALIVALTLTINGIRAARMNPAESLKYE